MNGSRLDEILENRAESRPEAVFVSERSGRATYGEIAEAAGRIASALGAQGVRRGDRVGLISMNSRRYVESYYGILMAGAVAVSLNIAADSRSHMEMLSDCGAKGVILGPKQVRSLTFLADLEGLEFAFASLPPEVPESVSPTGCRIVDLPSAMKAAPARTRDPHRLDTDRAAIVYTSGSTGKPRGAVLTHRNLVENTRSIVSYLGLTSEDRVLVILPFHYVYGKSLLNTHMAVGGSVVLENRTMYPQTILNTLEETQVTGLSGVPSTFAILLDKSNLAARELPSLRYVTQAGGPMTPALTRRLIDALPGKRIFVMYGATEASARLSYLDPAQLSRKLGSIGKAIPGVELRVLREDGSEADTDEVGEIVARGPNIMEGYWNAPNETALVLDENGYHTGDLGKRDDEGFLYVVGRAREMIKSGAHRISPRKIEDVLAEHPEVREAAVLGIPDPLLGEAIAAFVVTRTGLEIAADELSSWCRTRLAPYMVPTVLRSIREFPKNGSGKIDKLALSTLLARKAS